jgi:hypothetical protein
MMMSQISLHFPNADAPYNHLKVYCLLGIDLAPFPRPPTRAISQNSSPSAKNRKKQKSRDLRAPGPCLSQVAGADALGDAAADLSVLGAAEDLGVTGLAGVVPALGSGVADGGAEAG